MRPVQRAAGCADNPRSDADGDERRPRKICFFSAAGPGAASKRCEGGLGQEWYSSRGVRRRGGVARQIRRSRAATGLGGSVLGGGSRAKEPQVT